MNKLKQFLVGISFLIITVISPTEAPTVLKTPQQSSSTKSSFDYYSLPQEMHATVMNDRSLCYFKKQLLQRKIFEIEDTELYCKGQDFKRLINAIRMKECINCNNLTLIDVANKYIGKVEGKNYVFAKKVNDSLADSWDKTNTISFPLILQLITLARETGYSDWQGANWIFNEEGKFVCIDTEDRSFAHLDRGRELKYFECHLTLPRNQSLSLALSSIAWFRITSIERFNIEPYWKKKPRYKTIQLQLPNTMLNFVNPLYKLSSWMTPEALSFLDEYTKILSNNGLGQKVCTPLSENPAYDPQEINLDKVYEKLKTENLS